MKVVIYLPFATKFFGILNSSFYRLQKKKEAAAAKRERTKPITKTKLKTRLETNLQCICHGQSYKTRWYSLSGNYSKQ